MMNSTVDQQRDGRNWHVENGVIKLPVTEQPLSIHQYEVWQAEKMNWMRLNGCEKKKNCKQLYLSSTENRVYVKPKKHFMEKLFSVCNISMLIQGITLKNSWWNSLPGLLRCSRDQSSHILKLDVFSAVTSWIIFLSHSFGLLFTDMPFVVPELFPLMGAHVCAVSSMSALTYKR